MKAEHWRLGVATIMTAGLLAAGASAQNSAEGEVNIKDKTPAAASESEAAKPAGKPVKPQIVDRDPFVNQVITGTVRSTTAAVRPKPKSGTAAVAAAKGATGGAAGKVEEVEEIEIPAPEVTVNGIVSSGSGRQAIISTSNGTRMITTGMKLGDYRVATIGPNYVTFSYNGEKNFKVQLENEFGPK